MMGETPHNLVLNLKDTAVTGVISAATQRYREGLSFLEETIREELSHVYQTPAPPVNNGVLLKLDAGSRWTVTDTSYLTRLELAPGAVADAPDGKALRMTVNGVPTELQPGTYRGAVTVEVIEAGSGTGASELQ